MRITARQEPSERGLARVCQGPRGFTISANGKRVGNVMCKRDLFEPLARGWFWYASLEGLGHRNSASEGLYYETREEARDACVAWLRSLVKRSEKKGGGHE